MIFLALAAYPSYLFLNFSGFTDIMIGLSALLGHPTAKNFDHPYLATSLQAFWRRWHMSLTELLKDFIYLPTLSILNGWGLVDRKWTYPIGTTLVFTVMAYWHGSTWNYFVFSGLNVMGLLVENDLRARQRNSPANSWGSTWLRRLALWSFLAISFFFFENSPPQIKKIIDIVLLTWL
jgi:D-alanyl-lipoteichoic acid acyltransferase DltB (MBOAT superfamily)